MTKTFSITFTVKGKRYDFSTDKISFPCVNDDCLNFVYECYKKIGITPKQARNRYCLVDGWTDWVEFIV